MTAPVKYSARDLEVCVCGDFRRNHIGGVGPCIFNSHYQNGGLTHGYKCCERFEAAREKEGT